MCLPHHQDMTVQQAADIGYNFLVGEDGNVYEGRGWDTVGAHAKGYNTRSIGISFIGNFNYRKPNSAAINAAKQLISCGVSMVRHLFVFCDF